MIFFSWDIYKLLNILSLIKGLIISDFDWPTDIYNIINQSRERYGKIYSTREK